MLKLTIKKQENFLVYLSIVIPTYNRKKALLENIKSLTKQTYTDFELIVADDGSTDETDKLIKSIKNTPFAINYYWHQNAGRSAARNMGLKHANGEIVLFIDDHVLCHPKLVEEHVNMHKKLNGTNIMVVRGFAPLYRDKKDIPIQEEYINMDNYKFKGEQNPFISFFTGNVSIVKKLLLKVGGFDENFTEYGFQDSELGYRLRKAGSKIKVNPNAIVYVLSMKLGFEKRCDKMRQAGHSSVVLFRKNKWLGIYVGVNPFNLLVYILFSSFNNLLFKFLYELPYNKMTEKSSKYIKYQNRIRYFYFLIGMWEKLLNTKQLKEYYAAKSKK